MWWQEMEAYLKKEFFRNNIYNKVQKKNVAKNNLLSLSNIFYIFDPF